MHCIFLLVMYAFYDAEGIQAMKIKRYMLFL